MKLFDLHCDTLTELLKDGSNLRETSAVINLSGMQKFEKCVRCFAIWAPDVLTEKEASEHFDALYGVFQNQLSLYKNEIVQITDKNSLDDGRVGLVLTVENGSVLNGNLEKIEDIAKLGVKLFSLTWNSENSLGFGQLENKGLKPLGKKAVPILEENGITIDVSHISEKGFYDICEISTKPIVASHSNCKKLCTHNRNLTNDQISQIIRKKGLIGLNFYYEFLNNNSAKSSAYDLLKHAEHIINLGGEDVVSIGTDFDGGKMVDGFENDTQLLSLKEFFIKNGFSENITDKILFNNANNFFVNNL